MVTEEIKINGLIYFYPEDYPRFIEMGILMPSYITEEDLHDWVGYGEYLNLP